MDWQHGSIVDSSHTSEFGEYLSVNLPIFTKYLDLTFLFFVLPR